MNTKGPLRFFILLTLACAAIWIGGCGAPPPPPATEVVALRADRLPDDPADPQWSRAPVFRADLLLQDLVEPRLLEPSTPNVRVRALTDGRQVAFLLEWDDATRDDLPTAATFSDACAIQLPRSAEPDVPDPQMGQPGRAVEITLWRASWQAWTDGRADDIRSIHPNAAIDHYPFDAPALEPGSDAAREMAARYAPARRLGNAMEGPRTRPVQDLIGEGPGTLAPADDQSSSGRGARTEAGWHVLIVRPLPAGLEPGGRSEIAFAIWNGAQNEAGARKMRSPWVPLSIASGA